jgi:V-type H+-transporting ATPase subunit E
MHNQARLKVLKAREEHIRNVLEEGRKRLTDITNDQNRYQQVLEKLIAQGLFRLLEKDVLIRCRQQDVHIVQNSITSAVEQYQTATGKPVNVTLDQQNFLGNET